MSGWACDERFVQGSVSVTVRDSDVAATEVILLVLTCLRACSGSLTKTLRAVQAWLQSFRSGAWKSFWAAFQERNATNALPVLLNGPVYNLAQVIQARLSGRFKRILRDFQRYSRIRGRTSLEMLEKSNFLVGTSCDPDPLPLGRCGTHPIALSLS